MPELRTASYRYPPLRKPREAVSITGRLARGEKTLASFLQALRGAGGKTAANHRGCLVPRCVGFPPRPESLSRSGKKRGGAKVLRRRGGGDWELPLVCSPYWLFLWEPHPPAAPTACRKEAPEERHPASGSSHAPTPPSPRSPGGASRKLGAVFGAPFPVLGGRPRSRALGESPWNAEQAVSGKAGCRFWLVREHFFSLW